MRRTLVTSPVALPGPRGLDGQDVLEVGDQLGVVGVAVLDVLGGGGVDDRGQRGRDLRAAGLDVGQLLAHVLHRHRDLVLALERNLAGQHLVEHDPERVEVGLARSPCWPRACSGET